ncbi:MAG: hypothetical protein ACOVQ7_05065 [Limnoraphis robusta]|jgi:hypothetical protein
MARNVVGVRLLYRFGFGIFTDEEEYFWKFRLKRLQGWSFEDQEEN